MISPSLVKKDSSADGYRPVRCSSCQKLSDKAYHPFCSKRCADIDLGHWLNESYSVPSLEEGVSSFDGENE